MRQRRSSRRLGRLPYVAHVDHCTIDSPPLQYNRIHAKGHLSKTDDSVALPPVNIAQIRERMKPIEMKGT